MHARVQWLSGGFSWKPTAERCAGVVDISWRLRLMLDLSIDQRRNASSAPSSDGKFEAPSSVYVLARLKDRECDRVSSIVMAVASPVGWSIYLTKMASVCKAPRVDEERPTLRQTKGFEVVESDISSASLFEYTAKHAHLIGSDGRVDVHLAVFGAFGVCSHTSHVQVTVLVDLIFSFRCIVPSRAIIGILLSQEAC